MVFLKTAWKNILSEFFLNILSVLQIAFTIVVTLVLMTSIMMRYQYYKPLKEYFSGYGIYGIFAPYAMDNLENGVNMYSALGPDDILAKEEHATSILANTWSMCECADGKESNDFAYTDNLISGFTPALTEGRWLNPSYETTELEVVVSQNDYGWKVGDIIPLSFYNYPDCAYYDAKIVGILEENAKIPGSSEQYNNPNYMEFFRTYSFETEEIPAIILSSDYLEILNSTGEQPEIIQAVAGGYIVLFEDGYEQEKIEEYQAELSTCNGVISMNLEDMRENNRDYIFEQMFNLLPMIIIFFIMASIGCLSSTAMITNNRLRTYSIYYINGMTWKKCILINFMQSVFCSIMSVLIAVIGVLCIQNTGLRNLITIHYSTEAAVAIIVLLVFYAFISTIMPLIIIARNTPKQILTR